MTNPGTLPRLTDPPTFTDRAACETFIRRVREVYWLDAPILTSHLEMTDQVRLGETP